MKKIKERSLLQKITSQAHWAIHFRLQHISSYALNDIILCKKTCILLNKHHIITEQLKRAIKDDATNTKNIIIRERKRFLDANPERDKLPF